VSAPGEEQDPAAAGPILAAALAFLDSVMAGSLRPAEARRILQMLRSRHPGVDLDLIERRLDFDLSYEYQLLVEGPWAGVVGLSLSRKGGLPWALRGLQSWSNDILGTVNGRPVTVNQALVAVECLGNDAGLIGRLIDVALIDEELSRRPVYPTETDIEQAVEAIRRGLGLFTAERTREWLRQRGLEEEALLQKGRTAAALQLLKRRLSDGKVERRFSEHGASLDRVRLQVLSLGRGTRWPGGPPTLAASADALPALAGQLTRTGLPFSLHGPTWSSVCNLEPSLQRLIEDLPPGGVAGGDSMVVHLLERRPVVLDAVTVSVIENQILNEWLAERRAASEVHWFWGVEGVEERARQGRWPLPPETSTPDQLAPRSY
jgi:putative peptide maturation system protein